MKNPLETLKELAAKNASRARTAQSIAKRMSDNAEAAKKAAKG